MVVIRLVTLAVVGVAVLPGLNLALRLAGELNAVDTAGVLNHRERDQDRRGSSAVADQRHLFEALFLESCRNFAALCCDQSSVGAHGNLYVRRTQLERYIDTAYLAAFQENIIGYESLETWLRCGEAILASRQVQEFKVSVFIGGNFAIGVCGLMNDADLSTHDYRATLVGGGASYSRNCQLGPQRCARDERGQEQSTESRNWHIDLPIGNLIDAIRGGAVRQGLGSTLPMDMQNAYNYPWFSRIASVNVTASNFGRLNLSPNSDVVLRQNLMRQ
jgi:hypothetical protein